jgi:hypothetical protein
LVVSNRVLRARFQPQRLKHQDRPFFISPTYTGENSPLNDRKLNQKSSLSYNKRFEKHIMHYCFVLKPPAPQGEPKLKH